MLSRGGGLRPRFFMLTYIKKNLIIAALEDSLLTGKKAAGIATLAEMETLLAALRSRVNADPDAVTDKSIWQMYARLNALKFPSVSNIWWAFNDLSMFDSVETDTIGWSNITGKPAKFPPTAHTHDYASITDKPTTFEPSAHDHDYASITGKPTTFPPEIHAHVVTWENVQSKPSTFPPSDHTHPAQIVNWEDVQSKPTTFPPSDHAHDLLRIGGMLLRYNSGGYLEQSLNDGATWTPLVSESAPPAATAYALAWAESATEQLTRNILGAWINGDLQLWMRVYLDAAAQGTYWLTTEHFQLQYNYTGAIGVCYMDRYGDWNTAEDARTGIAGWHDIGLQWTPATGSAIIYLDGVGGSPLSVSNVALDDATQYAISLGNARYKIASLKWSHALTWTASAASAETMTDIIFDLPLSEGSGATTTDSTGTAWTIPAGVVWEAL